MNVVLCRFAKHSLACVLSSIKFLAPSELDLLSISYDTYYASLKFDLPFSANQIFIQSLPAIT